MPPEHYRVKLFADGAELGFIRNMAEKPWIKGFTTNPTLMRAAGVNDYHEFALKVVETVPDRPVSFEVIADDIPTMEAQARQIATWGPNVNIKIPITNTNRESTAGLVELETGVIRNARQIDDMFHPLARFANRCATANVSFDDLQTRVVLGQKMIAEVHYVEYAHPIALVEQCRDKL